MQSVNSLQPTESDTDRTNRLFLGFFNSIVGSDQTYVGQDQSVVNSTGQFVVANPDGTYSVAGVARSNLQPVVAAAGIGLMPLLLIIGAAWYFVRGGR